MQAGGTGFQKIRIIKMEAVFRKITQLNPRAAPVPSPPAPHPAADHRQNLDWAMIMIGISLPLAVEMAVQSFQANPQSHLPIMFHVLCLAIIFSFAFLFLGKLITTSSSEFPLTALALQGIGVVFAATAIFVAISIPLPFGLKCVTWILYAIFLISVTVICVTCNQIG